MDIQETIFRAKEFISLDDFGNARSLLRTVDTNHLAIRLLEEIDAAEAQKHLAAARAKLATQAAKDLHAIPSMILMLIVGNTLFCVLLISLLGILCGMA